MSSPISSSWSLRSWPFELQSSSSLSPSPRKRPVDERLVGLHARRGGDVVALELTDQGVQDDTGLLAGLAQDRLGAVDQRVLVGAVQRVARLEGDRLLPALLLDQSAGLGRRHDAVRERTLVLEGDQRDGPADELGALVPGPEARARVVGALGQIDALDELGLVPVVAVADLEDAEDLAVVRERELRTGGGVGGLGIGDGQDRRDAPGPLRAVALDVAAGQGRVVVGLAHRTRQRAERAVRDAVQRRAVDLVDLDLVASSFQLASRSTMRLTGAARPPWTGVRVETLMAVVRGGGATGSRGS